MGSVTVTKGHLNMATRIYSESVHLSTGTDISDDRVLQLNYITQEQEIAL